MYLKNHGIPSSSVDRAFAIVAPQRWMGDWLLVSWVLYGNTIGSQEWIPSGYWWNEYWLHGGELWEVLSFRYVSKEQTRYSISSARRFQGDFQHGKVHWSNIPTKPSSHSNLPLDRNSRIPKRMSYSGIESSHSFRIGIKCILLFEVV